MAGEVASSSGFAHSMSIEEMELELAVCKMVLLNTYSSDTMAQLLEMYKSLVKHASAGAGVAATPARAGPSEQQQRGQGAAVCNTSNEEAPSSSSSPTTTHEQQASTACAATQTEPASSSSYASKFPALQEVIEAWCPDDTDAAAWGSRSRHNCKASGSGNSTPQDGSQAAALSAAQDTAVYASSSSSRMAGAGSGSSSSSRAGDTRAQEEQAQTAHAGKASDPQLQPAPEAHHSDRKWRLDLEFYDGVEESRFACRANSVLVASDASEVLLLLLLASLQFKGASVLHALAVVVAAAAAVAGAAQAGLGAWYLEHREAFLIVLRAAFATVALMTRHHWTAALDVPPQDRAMAVAYSTGILAVPCMFFRLRLSRFLPLSAAVFAATAAGALGEAASAAAAGAAGVGDQAWRLALTLALSWAAPVTLLYVNEWSARQQFLADRGDADGGPPRSVGLRSGTGGGAAVASATMAAGAAAVAAGKSHSAVADAPCGSSGSCSALQ